MALWTNKILIYPYFRYSPPSQNGKIKGKKVLLPDVLTRVAMGKYAAGLVCKSDCTNFAQNLLIRL